MAEEFAPLVPQGTAQLPSTMLDTTLGQGRPLAPFQHPLHLHNRTERARNLLANGDCSYSCCRRELRATHTDYGTEA